MFNPADTTRIADSMTAATLGYAQATTAAYAEMIGIGLHFWGVALNGLAPSGPDVAPRQALAMKVEPKFGHALEDWCGLPWLDTGRVTKWQQLMVEVTPADAFVAWAGVIPLRGSCASWPAAKTMIDAGVPRAVAWPAAEANAAALDATVAAFAPIQRALTSVTSSTPSPGYALAAFQLPTAATAAWMFWTITTLTTGGPALVRA